MNRQLLKIAIGFALSLSSVAFATAGKHFDRVIYVVFENTDYKEAVAQPFMARLAQQGALFSNLVALVHPSQANYIALTSGSLNGVRGDGVQDVNASNIADLLEQKGLTWKAYVESWPGGCFTGGSRGSYARKHNPFISYLSISKNPARCANIVDTSQFDTDARNGTLPNYVFYVPNTKNDGHDTGVAFADKWYASKFQPYIADARFMANTILITTFDEDGGSRHNQIYSSVFGPSIKPGIYGEALNTYSLLKIVEDNWQLVPMSNEDAAAVTPDIWN
jgi:hypothetical protein